MFVFSCMLRFLTINPFLKCIWGVSRQLSQRAAREPQIVLFLTHVYDTKMYLKKLFDKRFRRIFSPAFQWYRQFFRNFPFSPSKTLAFYFSQKTSRALFGKYPFLRKKCSVFDLEGKKILKIYFLRYNTFCTFWRWKWIISEKLPTSLESWRKNTSETLIKQFFEVHFSIINMS